MKQTIIQRIAMLFPISGLTLTEDDNFDSEQLRYLESLLPSGSGIDKGMEINTDDSNRNKIVLTGDYHYMDGDGFYSGWFGFSVVVTSNLSNGVYIEAFSINYNNTELEEDIIVELFDDYLSETVSTVCFEIKEVKAGESYPVFI